MRPLNAPTSLHSWLPGKPTKRHRLPRRVRLELVPLEDRLSPAATPAAGTGLVADYYSDANLSALVRTRIDPGVNFNWGTGSPDVSVPADHFSVRWSGQIQAQYSETYTFSTVSAGGVRLWVNGQELINDWTDHAASTDSGTITLQAGQSYSIRLEYANNSGPAAAELFWSSPSTPKAAVPATQLFPSGGWLDADLATSGGSVSSAGSTYTVNGSGSFGGTADGGHFVYQSLVGDGSVVAQVTRGTGQGGLMIRDGLAAAGQMVGLFLAADGIHFESRSAAGAAATVTVTPTTATSTWLKLVRNGNFITGYSSPSGAGNSWTLVGTATLTLGTTANLGFAAAGGTGTVANPTVTPIVPIGANIPQLHDWDLNNAFVDIFKQSRDFYSVAKSAGGPLVTANVDANGWPTEDFMAFVQTGFANTAHIYNGTYKLSFTGRANVDTWVTPGGSVQNLHYDPATNTTTADVTLNASDSSGDWYFTLRFTNTNGTVKNVQLIRPGYDPANHP
ncbi:MAG TPA: PA14 domain-containing protein, partial [Gemmataceae bacterium]|nr:PA14 domain-containing protein [Gemmataceae bacterium]